VLVNVWAQQYFYTSLNKTLWIHFFGKTVAKKPNLKSQPILAVVLYWDVDNRRVVNSEQHTVGYYMTALFLGIYNDQACMHLYSFGYVTSEII